MANKKSANKLSKEDIQAVSEHTASLLEAKFDDLAAKIKLCAQKSEVEKVKCNVCVNRYETD